MKKRRFGIDIFLTSSCNQKCYYCTSYKPYLQKIKTDVQKIKYIVGILEKYNLNNFVLRLIGGEPGLVENLSEVVDFLKQKHLNRLEIYSNSTVRVKYPQYINDSAIRYIEHMFYMISNNRILKLGDIEFLPENQKNNYNVVILTDNFIMNYDKIDLEPLLHKNTIWKMVNNRSTFVSFTKDYLYRYENFLSMLKSHNLQVDNTLWDIKNLTLETRVACSLAPPSPVINLEENTIHHCSKQPLKTLKKEVSETNLDKLVKHKLFTEVPDYCMTCVDPSFYNREQFRLQSMWGHVLN